MGKKDKKVTQKATVRNSKVPNAIENPDAYLKNTPAWAFHKCDLECEKWSIRECDSFYDDIISKLASYEGLTWAEIQAASGGKKRGTNNHFEYISGMIKEAQKRAKELRLDVDQLFSLRLTGEMRLYGIVDRGVFYALWLDKNHEIYPSSK